MQFFWVILVYRGVKIVCASMHKACKTFFSECFFSLRTRNKSPVIHDNFFSFLFSKFIKSNIKLKSHIPHVQSLSTPLLAIKWPRIGWIVVMMCSFEFATINSFIFQAFVIRVGIVNSFTTIPMISLVPVLYFVPLVHLYASFQSVAILDLNSKIIIE